MKRFIRAGLLGLGFCAAASAQTNGIFADFATSHGAFTVWLDHTSAPRAVASFVGLATGAGSWLDPQGNVWTNRPFYAGSLFHRVVKDTNGSGIAIQGGGSAYASGSNTYFANAGYTMPEAVANGLLHANGVISMANSGPNTDGSQFFITTTNVPGWNGNYTVFGHVTTGLNVVTSIAAVAVQGAGERPVQDVVVSNVVIRRVGAAAEAFNIAAQGVPVAESGFMRAGTAGTNVELAIELVPDSGTRFRDSTDLVSWSSEDRGLYTGAVTVITGIVPRASLGPATYFHAARIRYPLPIAAPASHRGRTFYFQWNVSPATVYGVAFHSNWLTQGTCAVWEGTNAPVYRSVFIGDSWEQDAYSARLVFEDGFGRGYEYLLGYTPGAVTNRFTANWWPLTNIALRHPYTGTFTMP